MFSLFSKREKKVQPQWVSEYRSQEFSAKDELGYTFAVLDCETTGLNKRDSIVTIGAITCTINEIFTNDVLDQRYPMVLAGKSSEIHGELANDAEINVDRLLEQLVKFLKNHMIVGHNIAFDVGKINQILYERHGIKLKNQVLDTAQLAIRLDPVKYERTVGGQTNLSLDSLCKEYKIPIANRHTALGDAFLTAQLLQKQIYRLNQKGIVKLL